MNDFKTFVSLCLCGLFFGCAFGRLAPGVTKDGAGRGVGGVRREAQREAALVLIYSLPRLSAQAKLRGCCARAPASSWPQPL